MEFSREEKKAVARILEEAMLNNQNSRNNSFKNIASLAHSMNFDNDLLKEARLLSFHRAYDTVKRMSSPNKKMLIVILQKLAHSDMYADKNEMAIIISVFRLAGISIGREPEKVILRA